MSAECSRPADDVRATVRDVIDRFSAVPDDGWEKQADGLEWTCRETAAHILDDLGNYAMQLSGERGHGSGYTPLTEFLPRAGRPTFLFWPDENGGTRAVCECLDAVGGLLAAVVATAPPDRTGWHPHGDPDTTGLAAMGIAETTLHARDVLTAHGVDYRPDDAIVGRVLDRIFPHADRTGDPWHDLLSATGRTPATRGVEWRWDSSVR